MNARTRCRTLLVAAVFSLAAFAVAGVAHGQSRTIGVLSWADAPAKGAGILQPLVVELGELGYVHGASAQVDLRWAGGSRERAAEQAAALVAAGADVIVAHELPALDAARQATSTIPIVALTVETMASGGNVAGAPPSSPQLSVQRLRVVRQVLPRATRVAVVAPATAAGRSFVTETDIAAKKSRLRAIPVLVNAPAELGAAFARLGRDGVVVALVHPNFDAQRKDIAALARRYRIAAISESRAFAEAGNLLAFGPASRDLQRLAARAVHRILRGTNPADLSKEPAEQFELVLNLRVAKALHVTVPPSVTMQATHIIPE